MRTIFFAASLVLAAAACSSSSTGDSKTDGGGTADGGPGGGDSAGGDSAGGDGSEGSRALTCASHTYCTSYEYITFGGQTVAAPVGGTIANGLYRTGYGIKVSSGNDRGPTNVIQFSGNQYLRAGFGTHELGTFTVSGSTLSFMPTAECDSEKGTVVGTTPSAYSRPYTVDPSGALLLFYANQSAPPSSMVAFLPVKSFCLAPNTPATAPGGDTLQCHVTNCGCAENTDGAADTVTCNFVDGR